MMADLYMCRARMADSPGEDQDSENNRTNERGCEVRAHGVYDKWYMCVFCD